MNTPPRNFNESFNFNDSTSNFEKSSKKKVKFDQSVDIQQLEIENQKKLREKLDEKLMLERMEELKIDENFRKINGIPFGGNFGSPVPMDPFQKNEKVQDFGNASPTFNFQQQPNVFNSSIVNQSSPRFSTSKIFNNSRNSSFIRSNNSPAPKNIFSTSKRFNHSKSQFNNSITVQPSGNFNSSHSSTMFRSSFKSSKNSNNGFNDSYKIALCHEYRNTKQCSRGNNCRFAHGYDELRPPTNFPQQKSCKYFLQNLPCPFNEKCKFLHR